jgi:hypothetical protein
MHIKTKIKWSIYISSKRDLKEKNTIYFNRFVTISYDTINQNLFY